jgi:hypothetical protein
LKATPNLVSDAQQMIKHGEAPLSGRRPSRPKTAVSRSLLVVTYCAEIILRKHATLKEKFPARWFVRPWRQTWFCDECEADDAKEFVSL